jgi:hypothetical protein
VLVVGEEGGREPPPPMKLNQPRLGSDQAVRADHIAAGGLYSTVCAFVIARIASSVDMSGVVLASLIAPPAETAMLNAATLI